MDVLSLPCIEEFVSDLLDLMCDVKIRDEPGDIAMRIGQFNSETEFLSDIALGALDTEFFYPRHGRHLLKTSRSSHLSRTGIETSTCNALDRSTPKEVSVESLSINNTCCFSNGFRETKCTRHPVDLPECLFEISFLGILRAESLVPCPQPLHLLALL
ncbi:hypothetical protein ZOD2009_09445 [Haladaptatus paucihalophilus DX253]|uniref:Uncharacterized protein n=1 Tax=Haladaptatus paucihalophilus DX253 TaxID=797209 RepID=E7QSZ1_HALPU|nr:hypothetical protein ZOD2009_09445 [Haladaptatus paucihalophilus DX253]